MIVTGGWIVVLILSVIQKAIEYMAATPATADKYKQKV